MNKKFVNVMLALAVSCGSIATFTSCKDTDDDLRVEWSQGDADLQKKIDALQAQLDALARKQGQCKQECEALIQAYVNQLRQSLIQYIVSQDNALWEQISKNDQELMNLLNQKVDNSEFWLYINSILDKIEDLQNRPDNAGLTKAEITQMITDAINNTDFLTPAKLEEILLKKGYLTSADLPDFSKYVKTEDLANLVSGLQVIIDLQNDVTEIKNTLKTIQEAGYLNETEVNKLISAAIIKLQNEVIYPEISLLYQALSNLKTETNTSIADLEARVAALEQAVQEIQTIKDQLAQIDIRLSIAEQNALNAYYQAQMNLTRLNMLEALIGDCEGLKPLADEIRDLQKKYTDLNTELGKLDTRLTEQIEGVAGDLEVFSEALRQLTIRVAQNEQDIKELQEQVEKLLKLEERLNSLITSVIIQGTYNPLFGNFSLPIGVQSNILVNFYGKSEKQTYQFPSQQSSASFNNEDELTAAELNMLRQSGFTQLEIANGAILMDTKDGNLGKVFVTINPNNIDFSGQSLQLVDSRDKEATVVLKNLRGSNELLTFGYSRGGGNNNGFYEADATLPANEAAISGVSVGIHENLKSAMKDILKDKRNNLRSNVVSLMKAVYDQFNGILPAYAVKAPWKVDEKDYAVYSNYNLAATTFKPLSYGFLYDKSIDKKFPTFDPIKDAVLNIDPSKYHFDLSGVNVGVKEVTVEFYLKHIEIAYDGTIRIEGTVDVDGKTGDISGNIVEGDLDAFLGSINDQLNSQIDIWNGQLQDAYNDAMAELVDNVKDAVEQALEDLQGKINDQIDDMINDIQDEVNNKVGSYIDKFNKFIDAYNRIAGKLNDILENPNHFLQPTMLYNAGSGLHFLSNNAAAPTKFVAAGGNAITLYATSYTGEVVAPAYKKFVAVVNVTDNATKATAQGGDAALVAELKAINAGEYLADVRPGTQRRFALDASKMKAGHTYEILYTAVDYLGVTSTARYYISVVK